MKSAPDREWWTAAEIAEAGLPDLPGTKRRVNAMATRENWMGHADLVRRRSGRGGGYEYHWSLFPTRAQSLMLAQSGATAEPAPVVERDAAWTAFDALPAKAKEAARVRLGTLDKVEALERGGPCRDQAVRDVARLDGVSPRTIWNWLGMIEGVRRDDRLAYLAPRHRLAERKSRAKGVDPEFGDLIKSDFLRPEQPSMTSVYDRSARIAARQGITVPPIHTVRRWFKREVSEATQVLMRKGLDQLKAMFPPQVRDKSAMHAMEGVNGDFHRFDVFVRWPGENGQPGEIIRPQMVAFQDVYSGRLLSWRVDRSANSHAVQLCIGDMIECWGVPEHVLLDNGREFAAKLITGGTKTRFRFKVKDDDVPGLLTSLGCKVHWATPYSGQSKPIERAFRDLCDRVAKHPRFAGAYTGNRPDAKPENYGASAVPLEEFLAVLAEEVEAHNMRPGRRTEVAFGRSFAEAFDESYAISPIRKATEEQRRFWLMGAEGLRPNGRDGSIKFMGNVYWAPWLHEQRGQKLVARFDRADLWAGLHIYSLTDEYLGHAECQQKAGFFDIEDARAQAKARGDWLKAERRTADKHKVYTAAQLGAQLSEATPEPEDVTPVEARVVRMIPKDRPQAERAQDLVDEAAHEAFVADFEARRLSREAASEPEDERRALFDRARQIEAQLEAGTAITKDQKRWLASYQGSSDYRAWMTMLEDFGAAGLAK